MRKEFSSGNLIFTPQPVRYNGTRGNFWSVKELRGGCLVFMRSYFFPDHTTRKQIIFRVTTGAEL